MCYIYFIATKVKLPKEFLGKKEEGWILEEVAGKLSSVKVNFVNRNVYVVLTSRGCSCDFDFEEEYQEPWIHEQHEFGFQKIERKIRTLLGTIKSWEEKRRKKVQEKKKQFLSFRTQSMGLLGMLKMILLTQKSFEWYCCWTGQYDKPLTRKSEIDTKPENLGEKLEVEELEHKTIKLKCT